MCRHYYCLLFLSLTTIPAARVVRVFLVRSPLLRFEQCCWGRVRCCSPAAAALHLPFPWQYLAPHTRSLPDSAAANLWHHSAHKQSRLSRTHQTGRQDTLNAVTARLRAVSSELPCMCGASDYLGDDKAFTTASSCACPPTCEYTRRGFAATLHSVVGSPLFGLSGTRAMPTSESAAVNYCRCRYS